VQSGHEIADHMWEHHVPKDPVLEHDHLLKTANALEAIAGRRPVGSRSEHTLRLLKQEGFLYISHESADHRPYYLSDAEAGSTMLNLPFHYAIDDAMFYSFAWLGSGNAAQRITDPDRVLDLWWSAFWQQYRAGGYLNIVVHPFVSGRALRIEMMDRLITRMKTLPGVWFPTCEEVARHCLEYFPPRTPSARS
jgi:peptidoglycan/xylan/chitin deacetylase (PgdA/CDA1 family)